MTLMAAFKQEAAIFCNGQCKSASADIQPNRRGPPPPSFRLPDPLTHKSPSASGRSIPRLAAQRRCRQLEPLQSWSHPVRGKAHDAQTLGPAQPSNPICRLERRPAPWIGIWLGACPASSVGKGLSPDCCAGGVPGTVAIELASASSSMGGCTMSRRRPAIMNTHQAEDGSICLANSLKVSRTQQAFS